MDETTKFTSHMCSEQWLFVSEKPHYLVMKPLEWSTTFLKEVYKKWQSLTPPQKGSALMIDKLI
jgi:hypothetical protein